MAKTKKTNKCEPARAEAAAEVLAVVWLAEKYFELEYKIDEPPVVEEDSDGNPWVVVKIQVPQLDVDMWLDGIHDDHPDNQIEDV